KAPKKQVIVTPQETPAPVKATAVVTPTQPLKPIPRPAPEVPITEFDEHGPVTPTRAPAKTDKPVAASSTPANFPSTTLLHPAIARGEVNEEELRSRAKLLEQKAAEFEVVGSIQQIHPGPVVTTFEFKPEPGIKLSKITGLGDDLCLALEAESVR